MNLTDEELQRERGDHQLVTDAMASIRLIHRLFGDGEQAREWIRALALALYRTGCRDRHGEREALLATAADAITRAYLGQTARELEWPEAGGR